MLRSGQGRGLAVGLVGALALALPTPAAADCARDADQLRAHLVEAADRTARWNLAWAVGFGVAASAQLALALTRTRPFGEFDRDYEETLYVGAAKATIGLASRVVLPLRVHVPPPAADRCAELTALRTSLTAIATQERRTFWLTHLGGTALNLTGALILWHRRSFRVGAVSFLISFPVGPLSAYTLPRKSWHRWRDEREAWAVSLATDPEQATISIGRAF